MTLAKPKIVVLDSATVGKVSHDYWNQDAHLRDKARSFITRLQYLGVFVTFTLTHVSELLRHENEQVVWGRLKFLRSIPLIAWLRPYNRDWFPGTIPDLLCHELHAVVHGSAQNWQEIVNKVRPDIWETGMGREMFVEDDELWLIQMEKSKYLHAKEKYIASVDRTDPGQIRDLKIGDLLKLPIRPKEERAAYMRRFAQEMKNQLDCHGDKRLDCSQEIAIDFTNRRFQDIQAIDEMGGNPIQTLLWCQDVPKELISPEMTVKEYNELAIYAKRLKMLSGNLRPAVELTMKDVPQDMLPSYVLERKLSSIQRKAERVSGSDLGDRYISPLIFYADGVEVDKRTYEYLKQIRRNEPELASLMGQFFLSSDYSQIPKLFDE
jgi:hypothetical protein